MINKIIQIILSSIFLLMVSIAGIQAAQLGTLPTTSWENKFGDAEYSYYNRAAVFSPKDSELFIAGIYRSSAKDAPIFPEAIWIWKIDDKGEKIIDLKLKNPADDAKKD